MTAKLPFEIKTIPWDRLTESQRGFFCFQDDYLPLPREHALLIYRLTSESSRRVWKWLGPTLPAGWPESEPHFPTETILHLDHDSWNSDIGRQTVRQWLHNLGIAYSSDVFLVYESDQIIRMPWKLVVRYWDALGWSVNYSMIALDHTRQWACCFHHENAIVCGTFTEIAE
ncbi:hypothetical protein N9Y42_09330 [Mariniblastus sp.]|nr:hypothetical protein [Mariniblastus sp.]